MSFYPLYSLKAKDLVKFTKDTRIGKSNLEVPSFLRIYRAIEEKVVTSGIEATIILKQITIIINVYIKNMLR